ncbi:MAG: tetratricopeptide repeat protein [Alphaproteobacteria bacterium]|nr:MAG: tetratricopeptide repeat protein [Alphaproteobacteria bacterium]
MWRGIAFVIIGWLLALAPARAEWRRAESPSFVLYGNMSESQLRERSLLLEDFDRLLRRLASSDRPAPKLHVYFVDGIADLRMVREVPMSTAGYYMASDDGIAAIVDARAESRGTEILFHEYTHHFMWQHMPNTYPTWYVEGFAEYFSTVRFSGDHIDIGNYSRGRASSILDGAWLPMERVLNGGTDGLNAEAGAAYYAQSWLLVHYFYSTPERQRALSQFLRAFRRSPSGTDALLAATGMTPDALTRELRRYIQGGQIAYRQAQRASAAAPPPIVVTTMPTSTGDMILYEAALRVGIAEDRRQPYLQRIRAAARRYPEDPLAMRVLAHAELLYGDGASADRLLDRLLASAPNDADLMYLKGMRYLALAKADGAPESASASATLWFGRARAADPTHFQALIRYVESLHGDLASASEETRDLLVRAGQLAPQVASISLNAARVLIERGDYDEALRLLAPLVANPHDRSLAAAANELMQQAAGGRPRGMIEGKPDGEAPPGPTPAPAPHGTE